MGSSVSSCSSIDNTINSLIFLPPPIDKFNIKDFEKIFYILSNKKQIAAIIHSPSNSYNIPHEDRKYVVWSHGNATTIHHLNNYLKKLATILGVFVLGYDYKGYGLSDGIPTEKNCYDDLDAVVKYLITDYKAKKENITLIGRSLGTGVVMDYVAKKKWKEPIILISPYKTITRVICDTSCSSLSAPIDKFRTFNKLNKIYCPVKIFHGQLDNVIQISHGKDIYQNLKNKSLKPIWIPEADHDNILDLINYDDIKNVVFRRSEDLEDLDDDMNKFIYKM